MIERYKGPLLFAAALMVLFLLNELRVHVLVRRRTKELSDALMERDANAQSIRELQNNWARSSVSGRFLSFRA